MSEKKLEKGLNRRDFIKGAAVGAGAVALSGLGLGSAKAALLPEKWDKETDVVVIGYGGAGAVTAITAHDAGAKVLILEKQSADKHTPSTMMSGGAFWTFKNKADSVKYMKATAMGLTPDDVCETFAEATLTTVDWIKNIGGEVAGGGGRPEFPQLPGADGYDGYYRVKGEGRVGGEILFKLLSRNVESRGIEVLYETPTKELVQTPEGEIIGVIAESQGKDIAIKAKRALILACGGFEQDERMKMDYLKPYPFEFYANPGNTGDGIKMAQKAGAALWHMSSIGGRLICRFPDTPTAQIIGIAPPPYILVDQSGKRFANEYYQAKLSHAFLYTVLEFDFERVKYTRNPSWWIFDEKRRVAGPLPYAAGAVALGLIPWSKDNLAEIEKGWIIKADTIGGLATKIGLDLATLKDTVNTYNKYCATGKDPDFNRPKDTLVPLDTMPYYAVEMVAGGWGTQGGPMRNAKCQVLDPDGKPIPRFYTAGELGSFYGQVYQGGGMLTEVIITGRWAGENAAAEKPQE